MWKIGAGFYTLVSGSPKENGGQHVLSQRSCGNKMKQVILGSFGIARKSNSLCDCDPKIANHVRRIYQTSPKTILFWGSGSI